MDLVINIDDDSNCNDRVDDEYVWGSITSFLYVIGVGIIFSLLMYVIYEPYGSNVYAFISMIVTSIMLGLCFLITIFWHCICL